MKSKVIGGIMSTLLLISMLTLAFSIPSVGATEEKTIAEFLRMTTTENITVLENGTAHLAILINVPPSSLAEMYRKLLAAPPDADVEEEIPIPEKTTSKIHLSKKATETPISVREEFYKSIEEQQQFSLGFIIEIFESKMVPRSSSNGCRISISAHTSLPIVDITQINSHYKWKIAIGTKNAIGATAGAIFNSIELVQLMLESLPGEQLYESFWSTRIELPANAKFLNCDEIDGLNWKIDFGGGTYMNALVSLNGASTIVLDERIVVTEQKNAATPTYLYEAFSHYKAFNIEYLLPHSSSTFYKNEKYTEQAGVLTESGDTWSYTWTESWSDSVSQPFTYGPLDALLTVTASITFSGYVGWDFDLFEGLTRFESWMQLDTSVEVDFEVTATVDYDHTWDETLFELSTTFYFAYFGLPVWADLRITATGVLSVGAYGELTVTAGVSASASFTAGVRWTNTGGWEGIYDVSTSTSYYGPTIEAEASIWARPSVRFRIAFLFYGVAGPYIEFEPYAILTLTCSYPPPHGDWSLAVHLRITAGATFAGWLKDILGLDDWSIILTQPDILLMSWSGSWGPSSMSITETLDPSTTLTSSQVHVYGTATFNDGDAVSHADVIVTITQTGASWTTTTGSNGDYSAYISAPESAGSYTVEVSVSTGTLSDSTSRTLTVEDITDPGANYQLYRTTTCKDVQSVSPWDPITETPVFRTSDPTAYTWVHLIDVYIGLDYKFEWYDPDDNFYWSYEDSTDPPPPGQYWLWYKFSAGIYISGHMPEDMEGRWRCKVYIDEGGGYELVAIEDFVIRYEIISAYRTMAKDVLGGVDNPTEPYDPIDPTSKFLNTDPRALGWIRLDELAEAVEVKWEWRDPSGNIDFTWNYISDDPADEGALYYTWYKFWGWINIYGASRQSKIGTWELRAYIKDVYGNWDLEYSEYFMISDNTAPGAPGTPVDDGDYSTTGDVTWAWTEASEDWVISEYQIQVGTSPGGNDLFDGYVGPDLTITLTGLPSGSTYYARVRAMNTVGQWGPWSGVSDGITVDRPPMTLIIQSPRGEICYNDVILNWTGSDDVTPTPSLVYSYRLEGYDADWSPWTSSTSKQYNDLPNNYYTFEVQAKDQLGNVDPTPPNESFTVVPTPVHNLDTGLNYTRIQKAIDAPETLDGHTILVDAGAYYEHLIVNKTVSLVGENKFTTIIDGGGSGIVVHVVADNVSLSGFTLQRGEIGGGTINRLGVLKIDSNNNVITENILKETRSTVIGLWEANNNRISRNFLTNPMDISLWTIEMSDSHNNTIEENLINNNGTPGIYRQNPGIIIHRNSSRNTIQNNNFTNVPSETIYVSSGTDNTIKENIVTNCWRGIDIEGANSTVVGNVVSNCTEMGLWVMSGGNLLRGNILTNNTFNFGLLAHLPVSDYTTNDIDISNTANGKPVCFLVNEHNLSINSGTFPNVGYLALINSTGITVEDVNLTQNLEGILLVGVNNSIIKNANYSNNGVGIFLKDSCNNVITKNTISSNVYYGMYVLESVNNKIYHNNFRDTPLQISLSGASTNFWDNDYPSGGNYWSDYAGVDLYGGPYQNLTGGDGIGDTPYVIDEDNQDNYPLMNPWTPTETIVKVKNKEYPVTIVSNTTIDQIVATENTLKFKSSGPAGEKGYINVIFPIINSTPIRVKVDNDWLIPPPFPVINTNGTHYFIYFEFTLSTHDIDIDFAPTVPVGGISIPVNKLALLAPYIGLTVLLAVAVVTVVYVKKTKRHTETYSQTKNCVRTRYSTLSL